MSQSGDKTESAGSIRIVRSCCLRLVLLFIRG
nr:MAG TPA: hypothetical protein [Caudoviricetes sp.]